MNRCYLVLLCMFLFSSCGGERQPFHAVSSDSHLKTIHELDKALDQGQYDFVVKHGQLYIEEYPESDQAWNLLGWAYSKSNNLPKAKECFERVLSLNVTHDNAYVGLGSLHRKWGDNDKAREYYAEAVRIYPENPEALSSLLVIELLEGRYEEAVKLGEQAWEQNKVLATIPANLCLAYHYQGNINKREYFYKKAKHLKYDKMDVIDDIISGRINIGVQPQKTEAEN